MSASSYEKHKKELDKHFKERREEGLPAHRGFEHEADVCGVKVKTLAGLAYLESDGEVVLDGTALINVIHELQAAFQAVG